MVYLRNITICVLTRACFTFFALILGHASDSAEAQELSALEKALNNAGYQLYNPPRSNWGPGFVFSGDILNGRITNVKEVCPNLYGDADAPQSAAILFPNYTAKDKLNFGAALHFLRGLFGLDFDLNAVDRERTVEVKWQNIRETSYSEMDRWLADGAIKPIPIQCRRAIENLQGRNAFAGRVFVIVRAVAPESLIYDFSSTVNAQGSATAELWKAAQVKVQGQGVSTSATQLEVRKRLYVGYAAPVKLSEWIDTGQSSGELVRVTGETTNFQIAPD